MTKYEIYECDRCGKRMQLDVTPQCIKDIKGDASYDLCEDCYCSFGYFLEYTKDFDELADKLCAKEIEEIEEDSK